MYPFLASFCFMLLPVFLFRFKAKRNGSYFASFSFISLQNFRIILLSNFCFHFKNKLKETVSPGTILTVLNYSYFEPVWFWTFLDPTLSSSKPFQFWTFLILNLSGCWPFCLQNFLIPNLSETVNILSNSQPWAKTRMWISSLEEIYIKNGSKLLWHCPLNGSRDHRLHEKSANIELFGQIQIQIQIQNVYYLWAQN